MNSELRITDTNSANDSRGRALGLDGNDFLYVVVGIVAGIGAFLALYSVCAVSLIASALVSASIVAAPTFWVLMFRRNRPDGYAEDFFDDLLNREGWGFAPGNQPALPLLADAADERRDAAENHAIQHVHTSALQSAEMTRKPSIHAVSRGIVSANASSNASTADEANPLTASKK